MDQNDWRAIDGLTERQREIVKGISHGKSNVEIGRELGISVQTVKNHVTAILVRSASSDRARLAYLYGKWEQIQESSFAGGQVDVELLEGTNLLFRVVARNRLFIRLEQRDGRIDLFELPEKSSRQLRGLLLANVHGDDEADTSGEQVTQPAGD